MPSWTTHSIVYQPPSVWRVGHCEILGLRWHFRTLMVTQEKWFRTKVPGSLCGYSVLTKASSQSVPFGLPPVTTPISASTRKALVLALFGFWFNHSSVFLVSILLVPSLSYGSFLNDVFSLVLGKNQEGEAPEVAWCSHHVFLGTAVRVTSLTQEGISCILTSLPIPVSFYFFVVIFILSLIPSLIFLRVLWAMSMLLRWKSTLLRRILPEALGANMELRRTEQTR